MGSRISSPFDKSRKPSNGELEDDAHERMCDFIMSVIETLDLLIAKAGSVEAGTVARILHTAKEDLVYWAVDMNFDETLQEKFINRALYNNSMFAAHDFLPRFDDEKDKKKRLKKLKNGAMSKN